MKIKLSKSQWQKIGQQNNWGGMPEGWSDQSKMQQAYTAIPQQMQELNRLAQEFTAKLQSSGNNINDSMPIMVKINIAAKNLHQLSQQTITQMENELSKAGKLKGGF